VNLAILGMTLGREAFICSLLQLLLGCLSRAMYGATCEPKANCGTPRLYLTIGSIAIASTMENRSGNVKLLLVEK
jgi:hypothetical protein